jgi:hypothetical protein
MSDSFKVRTMMNGLAVIENLHRTTGLGGLMRVSIPGNLQLPVVMTGAAGDSIQSIAGPNGSNLLLPGWRDIHLSPPNPTARASSPPSTPTGLTRRGFFFVQPGKSSSLLLGPNSARTGRRVTGLNASSYMVCFIRSPASLGSAARSACANSGDNTGLRAVF